MAFSSNFIFILEMLEDNPVIMVLWAAFGIFFSSLVLFAPLIIFLRKISVKDKAEDFIGLVTSILFICWIVGFITQMILFFSGIPGIKLFFIWISMFLTYVVFGIFNQKMILKWGSTMTRTDG